MSRQGGGTINGNIFQKAADDALQQYKAG